MGLLWGTGTDIGAMEAMYAMVIAVVTAMVQAKGIAMWRSYKHKKRQISLC